MFNHDAIAPIIREPDGVVRWECNSAGIFAALGRTTWEPRRPASSIAGLRSIGTVGGCLAPVLAESDILHIEMGGAYGHGDIVVFTWDPELVSEAERADRPEMRGFVREARRGGLFAKLYVRGPGNMEYLVCNDSMFELGRNRITGVVRAVTRAGAAAALSALSACGTNIEDNAVSQTVSNYSATLASYSPPLSGVTQDADVISASITTTGGLVAIDVSTNCLLSYAATYYWGIATVSVARGGTPLTSSNFDLIALGYSASGSPGATITLSTTDAPAVGTYTYSLHFHYAASGASGTPTAKFTSNFIKIREYKK
jgi:hypothetical protein